MPTTQAISLSSLLGFFLTISILVHPSNSAIDSFVYGGCSQLKYAHGTPYESNVNSILASLVNSASTSNYNSFKISVPGSSQNDIVYGLFQCRGDLTNSDCRECVAHSVSQIGIVCPDSTGGALQLDGCLVKYDNTPFLGAEDKTVVMKKCGPSIGLDSSARSDALLAYLTAGGQFFRVGGSGNAQGMAQCVQDLSLSECQDCLTEAIGRLRNECGSSAWGDMFLAKCYVRYSERGDYSKSDDNDTEKTLAIIIGLIAGVSLIIVFLSFLRKIFEKKGGK
ncbi:plasmodesmata-located protein 6-like [Cornus florida]|uniref:plasmodesmata-located protein 6-like n=1 Tax=Cornus florida TaxID=4283 RepID=UPI00289ECAEF|nr:plasmodesmata-located protein 6-like [Cornus florida]